MKMLIVIEYRSVTSRRHDNALPGSKQHASLLDRCEKCTLFPSRLYSTLRYTYMSLFIASRRNPMLKKFELCK